MKAKKKIELQGAVTLSVAEMKQVYGGAGDSDTSGTKTGSCMTENAPCVAKALNAGVPGAITGFCTTASGIDSSNKVVFECHCALDTGSTVVSGTSGLSTLYQTCPTVK